MASTKVATKDISKEGAEKLVISVRDGLKTINKGYLAIAGDVAKLYDCKGFKALGYNNFDDMCKMEFEMSHGTTVGIRKVFKQFGSITKDNQYIIPEKYTEYGYTKLLFFTDKRFEEANIKPLEIFTPDMTIKEMTEALNTALGDKADKQDKEAIETTANEVTPPTVTAEEPTATAEEVNPIKEAIANLDEIINLANMARKALNLKPEKDSLFDMIIATAGEIKKEANKIK